MQIELLTPEVARERAERASRFLAADPRVRLVFLFGSAVDPGRKGVGDVDLAVLTEPALPLRERLNLAADAALAAGGEFDVVFLNEAPVVLARKVADTGVCLYAASPDLEAELVISTRMRYLDFKHLLDEQWRLAGERLRARRHGRRWMDAMRKRFLRLEEVVSQLEELAGLDRATLTESLVHAWAVERGLALAAEILFDIGNHVLYAHLGVAAESYEDILDQLAHHGVLDSGLRLRLEGLGGFRNILIHDYLRLDREKVLDALEGAPRDFDDFAREVRSWLARELPPVRKDGGA